MDTNILQVILSLVGILLAGLVPHVARAIVKKLNSDRSINRMIEYDKIGEGILNLIRIQHPDWDIVDKVDNFKDDLIDAILNDARSTNNPAIAARVAASAIVKAKNGGK